MNSNQQRYSLHLSGVTYLLMSLFVLSVSCSPKENEQAATVGIESETNRVHNDLSITVSCASSTRDLMNDLVNRFHQAQSGTIRINVGASSSLANQILSGAPADLFVSASQQWADEVTQAELAIEQRRLLTNRLVLIVPSQKPSSVNEPVDLLKPSVSKIALAGEKVPAGIYAQQALSKLKLFDQLVQSSKIVRGQDVRTAMNYVERGEAEAGIVYSTDVSMSKGIVQVYEFDPALHDEIVYVLIRLKYSKEKPLAAAFFNFLCSEAAVASYSKFGFSRITDKIDSNETKSN